MPGFVHLDRRTGGDRARWHKPVGFFKKQELCGSGITEEVRPPSTLSMGERAASEGLHEVGAWGRSICSFLIPCLFPPTSAPDIRLDWETYAPDDREDRLVELLVFYGPPFPLQGQAGNDLLCSEAPEGSSSFGSPSLSTELVSSHEAVRRGAGWAGSSGVASGS